MPNRLELLGSTPAASVTVNGSATVRQAERYGIEIPVNNSKSATQVNLTVTATQGAESLSKTLKRDHPAANQAYSYDSDGNLLNDGIWAYSWDAENRLISSEYQLATTDADKRKYNYVYDHQSRRVLKRELLWNTTRSTWYAERQTKYIYDGWNVVVELFNENTVWKKHTWGLDLSGSMQGAGGVGGLLATENILKNYAAALTYDGNGNVTTLVKKDTSTLLAEYEYTAFGRTLTKSGKHANDNLYRFSTKPQEAHNNWYYYGYRYYDPVMGRWPSRDPIEERGGVNLYAMVGNDTINRVDILGLVHRPGGAVANIDQIPTIMDSLGNTVAAKAMRRWFSRAPGDTSPVDDILTIKWALKEPIVKRQFRLLITGMAFNDTAANVLKGIIKNNGVTSEFDYTTGKASSQHDNHYQTAKISITTSGSSDFSMAVSRSSLHVVAAGKVAGDKICVNKIGIYLRDQYDFKGTQPLSLGLGVWDFKEMAFKGVTELWLSDGQYRIKNHHFRSYQTKFGKGEDYKSFSNIVTNKLNKTWVIKK